MFRLRSLRIEKFRDLRGGADLRFGDGVNLVLGRNASGKTNLLKLIAMIGKGDFSSLSGEEFAFSWEMEGEAVEGEGLAILRGAFEQGPPASLGDDPRWAGATLPRPFRFEVDVRSGDEGIRVWGSSEAGWRCSVDGGEERALTARVELFASIFFAVFAASRAVAGKEGGIRLLSLLEFNRACVGRLDEGLLSFLALLGEPAAERELVPLVPHSAAVRRKGLTSWLLPGVGPLQFAFSTVKQENPDPVVEVRVGSQPLGPLCGALGADLIELRPREVSRERMGLTVTEVQYRGLDLRLTFGDRSISDPALLSYGQRRMIAFFWYAAATGDGFLVADELGNGLHHSWLSACFEAIGDRQAFIAAQDPLVFDHVEFADAADLRARVVVCTPTPPDHPPGRGWSWRQPDEAEAAEFMAAYDVGIQTVSELLRAHGLW